MPGNLFTPVSVRRRSAAQGCANAHTDAAAPGDGRVDHVNAGGGHDTEDRGSLNDEYNDENDRFSHLSNTW